MAGVLVISKKLYAEFKAKGWIDEKIEKAEIQKQNEILMKWAEETSTINSNEEFQQMISEFKPKPSEVAHNFVGL